VIDIAENELDADAMPDPAQEAEEETDVSNMLVGSESKEQRMLPPTAPEDL
jgi:hypothetical protein